MVQVGYKIDEERTHNARISTLVTSAGLVAEIKGKKKGNEPKGLPLCFTSTSVAIKWLNYPCSSHEGPIERSYKLLDSSEHRIKANKDLLDRYVGKKDTSTFGAVGCRLYKRKKFKTNF